MTRWESQEERSERDGWWKEALRDPGFVQQFDEVREAVSVGDLTLADLGGFTTDEIDSAFAGACELLNTGKLDEAVQIAGYLIMLAPWDPRFYYLAGVCFHHRKQHDAAVRYFDVALAFGEDAVTLMAKGESLMMLRRREEARSVLQRGVAIAPANDEKIAPHLTRARQLLETYLGGGVH